VTAGHQPSVRGRSLSISQQHLGGTGAPTAVVEEILDMVSRRGLSSSATCRMAPVQSKRLLHLSSVSKLSSAAAVIKTVLFVTKHLNDAMYSISETQTRNLSSFLKIGMFYSTQRTVFSTEPSHKKVEKKKRERENQKMGIWAIA